MEATPVTVAHTTATAAADPAHGRPAAAFSVLSNVRGSAVEDTFVLMDDLRLDSPLHSACAPVVPLFGVYDGHGGGAAAQHCARRLHRLIAARLEALLQSNPDGLGAKACPLETGAVEGALREAFVAADEELQASGVLDNNSGSTALVALLTTSSIWLAWAGDSRAVLVRDGKAAEATSDHRPAQREDEKARIERAGGMLLNNGGLRLMGMLATTRAIGDHDLQPYGLTPVPEVMRLPRGPHDEFLVLASDGLWDKVTPQEAAILAHNAWCRIAAARPSWDSAQQGPLPSGDPSPLPQGPLVNTTETSAPQAKAAACCGGTAQGPVATGQSLVSPSLTTALSDTVALHHQDSAARSGHAAPAAAAAGIKPACAHAANKPTSDACGDTANHTVGSAGAAAGTAPLTPPPPGRTCRACKAARIAAAAMSRCARSRRSRDDTTVVVVNLQQHCQCSRSWATVSAGGPEEEEEAAAFMGLNARGSLPPEVTAAAAAVRSSSGGILNRSASSSVPGVRGLSADVDWGKLARGGSSGKGGLEAAAAAAAAITGGSNPSKVPVLASVDDTTTMSSPGAATASGSGGLAGSSSAGYNAQAAAVPLRAGLVTRAPGYESPADSEDFQPMGEARAPSQDEVVGGFAGPVDPPTSSTAGGAGPSTAAPAAGASPSDPLTAMSPFAVSSDTAGGPPRTGSFLAPQTAGSPGLSGAAADPWVGGVSPWGAVTVFSGVALADDDAGPDSGDEGCEDNTGTGTDNVSGAEGGGSSTLAALSARLSRGLGTRDSARGVAARVSARGSGEGQAVPATGASGECGGGTW